MVYPLYIGVVNEYERRKKQMEKSGTGTRRGVRVCKDGTIEPLFQQTNIHSRMFQCNKMRKKGFKGK